MPQQSKPARKRSGPGAPDYDVVALSVPIVYTLDGDHDPNGRMYALARHAPLLNWLHERWKEHDEFLPGLHRRRQLIQLVVDGLVRYGRMLDKLGGGEPLGDTPHEKAVRQNLHATVDELVAALDELTDGHVRELDPDPVVRDRWLAEWRAALLQVDQALVVALRRVDESLDAEAPGWPDGWQRLMFNDHRHDVTGLGVDTPPYDRCNPLRPVPLVRPLVLRAHRGEQLTVRLRNDIRDRAHVGLHAQGRGLGGPGGSGVRYGDGADVGRNPDTTAAFGRTVTYRWACPDEGVWPLNDLADVRGTEEGGNVHGLFGALVVGDPGTTYHDPETGSELHGEERAAVGLYVDIHVEGDAGRGADPEGEYVDLHLHGLRSHREFTVFFHDEPEVHSGFHLVGEHTVMPLSYRAEPMPNRLPHRMRRLAERTAPEPPPDQVGIDHSAVKIELDDDLGEVFRIARTPEGEFLERVAGEEQHHSSWLFGDPITPILRCYKGDPARIRLVHGGVKETHVFHLHVHQWRATPQDGARPGTAAGSQLLDSITIGPQTAYTIDPLYGSGSRQHLPGDVIWHCHLYPHFHHGMWGLWRSFDRFVDGSLAFPDGTPGRRLAPLPGRDPDPVEADHPGFPWFIDAKFPQKAPPPPALLPEHKYGRRALLDMPLHSKLEKAAFAKGVVKRPRPGMLFVDLDGDQVTWNQKAGLPPPRIIHYDVEVASGLVEYNENGWHDDNGHFYRLTGIAISQLDGTGEVVTCEPVAAPPFTGPKPFFPRANQGDIVELTFINTLGTLPADDFDLITPPVECGLHVHLVKFDVMAADGSSTGWNYLSGASCREAVGPDLAGDAVSRIVGFHRWVVDEEFGPCFFHDHLLANFRQKHGLFAALIAEPFRSQWLTTDQNGTAWSDAEAVIVPRDADVTSPGTLPPYREACLAIGDFVPLHDGRGEPLNPPGELGGDDDPGAMAVNYRNAPLRFRGDDPSEWFSSREHRPDELEPPDPDGVPRRFGDPDTGVIRTYPGERLRIRLIQGSHEEQHGFVLHGMRWRREWHGSTSTLVNQQTLGISEAFTLDIDPEEASPYGPGDHLWSFHAMDDLWLGCWGLIRALIPGPIHTDLPPLPTSPGPTRPVPSRPTEPDRDYLVVARRREHKYRGHVLTDPWGLEYVLADRPPLTLPDDHLRIDQVHDEPGPLVLRARAGEWVRVTLVNEVLLPELDDDGAGVPAGHEDDPRFFADPLLPRFGVEPSPPRLPIEHVDELGDPDRRTVSPRVSLHAALLSYDVVSDDGSNVGRNHDGTVGTLPVDDAEHAAHGAEATTVVLRDDHGNHVERNWREYWWYADPLLAPPGGAGQVCLLQDMADIRNHRHHGLVGALVVLPADHTPQDGHGGERWSGPEARIVDDADKTVAHEKVLFLQDGLRLFVAGNPAEPARDVVPGDDPEDSGQKGISYRTEPVHPRTQLAVREPHTPTMEVPDDATVWLRVVSSADKPRNHTFTVHGVSWPSAPRPGPGPRAGAVGGITAGSVHDLVFEVEARGDHAYRDGVFRWSVEQGMWGILRVR
jgi:hypothetical protein